MTMHLRKKFTLDGAGGILTAPCAACGETTINQPHVEQHATWNRFAERCRPDSLAHEGEDGLTFVPLSR